MNHVFTKYKLKMVKEESSKYNVEKLLTSTSSAAEVLRSVYQLQDEPEEIFMVLALDRKNSLIGAFEVSRGTLSESVVHPREVFKRLIVANASATILAHNHPSGISTPSDADMQTTKRLKEAGTLLGIDVLDHIIIGDSYYSFAENGTL